MKEAHYPFFHGFGLFVFPGPPQDRWACGWLTGPDSDLICVKRSIMATWQADLTLSPVCFNPLLAIMAYIMKRILIVLDHNVSSLLEDDEQCG